MILAVTNPKPRRRLWQFRLRTLLVLISLIANLLAWVVHQRARIQARAAVLASCGEFDSQEAMPQPRWHRFLFGEDPFYGKTYGATSGATSADMPQIGELEQLEIYTLLVLRSLIRTWPTWDN